MSEGNATGADRRISSLKDRLRKKTSRSIQYPLRSSYLSVCLMIRSLQTFGQHPIDSHHEDKQVTSFSSKYPFARPRTLKNIAQSNGMSLYSTAYSYSFLLFIDLPPYSHRICQLRQNLFSILPSNAGIRDTNTILQAGLSLLRKLLRACMNLVSRRFFHLTLKSSTHLR